MQDTECRMQDTGAMIKGKGGKREVTLEVKILWLV